jgi:hypothetical protein
MNGVSTTLTVSQLGTGKLAATLAALTVGKLPAP